MPVPVTTFAPIATGGVNQQPITSFVYENIGVNIDILPRTHHDDEVSLSLKVTLSSISGSGFGGLPTFGNREISTTIRLKDGETNMLAGLIRDDERTSLAGIPGLSDLPFVGHLFANNHRADTADRHRAHADPAHCPRARSVGIGSAAVPAGTRSAGRRRRRAGGRAEGNPAAGSRVRTVAICADATRPERLREPATSFPQPLQPPVVFPQPLQGTLPGVTMPITPPPPPPKKPGG